MINEKARNYKLDLMKGIAIILVVIGHTGSPITNWIYTFHMALFFMISGYCFNEKHSSSVSNVKKYIVSKVKRLYFPYVGCNVIFVLLTNFFIKIYFCSNDPEFLKLVSNDYPYGLVKEITWGNILKKIARCFVFASDAPMGGATWFLETLFFISIGYCIVRYLMPKCHYIDIITLVLSIFFSILINQKIIDFPVHINSFCCSYIAYYLGTILKRFEERIHYNMYFCCFAAILLFIFSLLGEVNVSDGTITNVVFYIVASLMGWYIVSTLANTIYIHTNRVFKCFLDYCGKHTMSIVFLHFLAFKVVSLFIIIRRGDDIRLLGTYPVIENITWIDYFIYTLVGVMLPLLINYFYSKLKEGVVNFRKSLFEYN